MTKSKSELIRAGFFLGAVGMAFGLWLIFRNMNFMYLGLFWFLAHQLYVIPGVNRKYSLIMGAPVRKWRSFIPLLNETDIFTPALERVTLILGIVLYADVLILVMPYIGLDFLPGVIRSIFGDSAALVFPFYLGVTAISLYIILNVFRGLGFASVAGVIDSQLKEFFHAKVNTTGVFIRLFVLFVPFLRTMSLAQLHDRLNNLVRVHKSHTMKDKEFLED